MKWLIVVLLALVTFCPAQVITGVRHRKVVAGGGGTNIAFVSGATQVCVSALNICTITYTCTIGHFCAVHVIAYNTAADAITSVTDSNAVSLTKDLQIGATISDTLDMNWFSYTSPGTSTTFSANYTGFDTIIMSVADFTFSGTMVKDAVASAQNFFGAGTVWKGQSITPASSKYEVVLAGAFNLFGPNPTGTAPWLTATNGNDGTYFGGIIYQIVPSTSGAYQPTGATASSANTTALSISYKAN